MTTTKQEFCDLAVLHMLGNPNMVDKTNAGTSIAHNCYALAEQLWNAREAVINGILTAPAVPVPYSGVPIAVAGQPYPQMPNAPGGMPVAQPVPGYNAMHQVNPTAGLVQGGPQSHPYGPTVLATDMKGANMSAQNPLMPGGLGTPGMASPGVMATPNGARPAAIQGEAQVLATDFRGQHLSAKNPVIAGGPPVEGAPPAPVPMPDIPNSFAPPPK